MTSSRLEEEIRSIVGERGPMGIDDIHGAINAEMNGLEPDHGEVMHTVMGMEDMFMDNVGRFHVGYMLGDNGS